MNLRAVANVVGNLQLIVSLVLVVPFVVGIILDGEHPLYRQELWGFAVAIGVGLAVGLWARYGLRADYQKIRTREGFAIVTFSWVASCALGMLPFVVSGAIDSVVDAWFETLSGFTTTGASILPKVEVLPRGLMLWRCTTQWLGGMGIIVLSVALLPRLGVGGLRMFKAEAPGGAVFERDQPRIADVAKALWQLYLSFTVICTLVYWRLGMTLFEAVCHSFTTLSTGGFSTSTASLAHFSPAIQWAATVFMVLGAINYALYSHLLRRHWKAVSNNSELRLYLLGFIVCVLFGTLAFGTFDHTTLRHVAFQIASALSSTGFATQDFNLWPPLAMALLFFVFVVGGCMGSTAGGMKVARVVVFAKTIWRHVHAMVFPHGVRPVRVNGKVIDKELAGIILAFCGAYTACVVLGTLVMAAAGYDFLTAISGAVSVLSNFGPGLGAVGPSANWAHLPDTAKWVMSALMLVGRLEVFSVLVLLTPWAWKR